MSPCAVCDNTDCQNRTIRSETLDELYELLHQHHINSYERNEMAQYVHGLTLPDGSHQCHGFTIFDDNDEIIGWRTFAHGGFYSGEIFGGKER